jgi:peptide/nickel transport system permease protein
VFSFVARRLLSGAVLLFVIATVTFFLIRSNGTSIARTLLGETATSEQIAAKTSELGLDRPVVAQYADWAANAVRGDFGSSWLTNESVAGALVDRLPVTLSIALLAIVLTTVLAVGIGVLAAVKRGWLDRVVQVLAVLGFAMPGVWFALLLVLVFAITLRWFPATGYVPLSESPSAWIIALALPVIAISVGAVAATAQQVRSSMIVTLEQDYVRTLRSRGLSERRIVLQHALRNAAPTGLTVISLHFISLLGSTVVIEKIFALPGIGSMVLNATVGGDSPQVLGVVVMMVIVVVVVNLVIDLSVGWLNPKARTR